MRSTSGGSDSIVVVVANVDIIVLEMGVEPLRGLDEGWWFESSSSNCSND